MKTQKLRNVLWLLKKEELVELWNYVKRRVGGDENYCKSCVADGFIAPVIES